MTDSTQPFSAEDVRRMVEHMNDDHGDAVLAYVHHYGQWPEATAATLLDITSRDIAIEAQAPSGPRRLRIAFDHTLQDSHDAHLTLVKMAKTAKRKLPS